MISSKYISKFAMALMSVVLALCILAMVYYDKLQSFIGENVYSMEYETGLFDTSEILTIDIVMDGEEWDEMLGNAMAEEYYKCDVIINGNTFYSVGIRPKGNTSLSSIAMDPDNNRYSFKLEFDRFADGQTCYGLDKLVLNNNYADSTAMKEAIVYDMYRFMGVDAPLYNYAKISVNGEYWGIYMALEAVEESFMLRNFGTQKGYLYKPDSMNMGNGGRKEYVNGGEFKRPDFGGENFPHHDFNPENTDENTAEQWKREFENGQFPKGPGMGGGNGANLNYIDDNLSSYSAIWDGAVTGSTDADHKRVIKALENIGEGNNVEKYVDVDNVLKYMAVHNFSVNDDSLSGSMAHNYYLYEFDGGLNIIPWDYNLAFGGMHGSDASGVINEPIDDYYSLTEFFNFVFDNEEYKSLYHHHYSKLVEEYFYGGKFEETYNRIRGQIDELIKSDPNSMYSYDEYVKGAEVLYETLMLRAQSVRGQLDGTIPSTSEGQKADSSTLVDASHINISDMGVMNMGRRNEE